MRPRPKPEEDELPIDDGPENDEHDAPDPEDAEDDDEGEYYEEEPLIDPDEAGR